MSINKITMAVAVVLFSAPLFTSKAYAISSTYRAQLERSGCTQVTELNGTCDIHLTKAQNKAAAQSPAAKEHAQIAAFLEEKVLEKKRDDAYAALTANGWENTEPLTWVKAKHRVILDIGGKDQIISATLQK